ncbi:3-hydroxybutyryl-CoA dehydrogenase FadB3 [Meredithblackwellia eburnea MCA 4105]
MSNDISRPVTIIGGGFQGRRIALMWASQGRPVIVFDKWESARTQTVEYFEENAGKLAKDEKPGPLTVTDDLKIALKNPWLVIEAVPEILILKRSVFKDLESLAPNDCIFATNSSSYKSAEVCEEIEAKDRVCNIHYFRPPEVVACEVMTSGHTRPELITQLLEELKTHGHTPFLVRKESTGFIHNRIWAAIKREALRVVAEGVADPSDVDSLFKARFKTPQGPFEIMDGVGLDVVLDIENHYADEQPHLPASPRELLNKYTGAGRLGTKSGAGFYDWKVEGAPVVLPVLQ